MQILASSPSGMVELGGQGCIVGLKTKFEIQHFRQAWKEFHHGGEDVNCGAKSLHISYLFKNIYTCIDISLMKQVLQGLWGVFFQLCRTV